MENIDNIEKISFIEKMKPLQILYNLSRAGITWESSQKFENTLKEKNLEERLGDLTKEQIEAEGWGIENDHPCSMDY